MPLAALLVACVAVALPTRAAPREVAATPDESFNEYVPGAALLEGRLLAPCCWTQTLDIHGSPIANELRREIRHRLKAGETPEAIQADLVRRYTTRILAVPPDHPLSRIGTILSVALLGAGVFAGSRVARWKKRASKPPSVPPNAGASSNDEWDARLDAELEDED